MDTSNIQLSIKLQPEYGWAIKNTPVFGPSSIVSGHVDLQILNQEILSRIDKIRIVFHGSERMMNINTGSLIKRKQFFGTQRTIWDSKHPQKDLTVMNKHSFPFIIQLPNVQFPPSMDYPHYKCYYMVSVYIDEIENHINTRTSINPKETLQEYNQPIIFMPFIETCLFKTPLIQSIPPKPKKNNKKDHHQQQQSIKLSTHALDYVPGDSIKLDVTIPDYFYQSNNNNDSSTTTCVFSSMSLTLTQIVKSLNQVHQSTVSTLKIPLVSSQSSSTSSSAFSFNPLKQQIELPLSSDLTPSITYSDAISVNYSLHVQFHENKLKLSSFFSSSSSDHYHLTLPIRIGTLGYGIRPSEELQVYSIFRTSFENQENDSRPSLPNPTFLQNVEYEDALPVYEVDPQLPSYDSFISNYSPTPCVN
ncbi:hypothetical protein BJ944DRAFT_289645 [Cunninghamella echinulata]|nr:hypothetical protein BJ944DRAFT_289645 [Cunninghamella echinulata]